MRRGPARDLFTTAMIVAMGVCELTPITPVSRCCLGCAWKPGGPVHRQAFPPKKRSAEGARPAACIN